jgi:hypothetical protein
MDWVHLTQNRDKWQAAVNVLMKLWVPHNVGNFWFGWLVGRSVSWLINSLTDQKMSQVSDLTKCICKPQLITCCFLCIWWITY